MCGCHGNAWHSSSENAIFHNAMLYWSCVRAKFHDNLVKTAEVTGSRIFPQKNVVTMATMTPPTPKTQRHVISVLCAKFHANRVKTAEAKGKLNYFPRCVVAMATLGVAVPKIQFFTTPCYIGPVCQIS